MQTLFLPVTAPAALGTQGQDADLGVPWAFLPPLPTSAPAGLQLAPIPAQSAHSTVLGGLVSLSREAPGS